jgi:hypothetical protein
MTTEQTEQTEKIYPVAWTFVARRFEDGGLFIVRVIEIDGAEHFVVDDLTWVFPHVEMFVTYKPEGPSDWIKDHVVKIAFEQGNSKQYDAPVISYAKLLLDAYFYMPEDTARAFICDVDEGRKKARIEAAEKGLKLLKSETKEKAVEAEAEDYQAERRTRENMRDYIVNFWQRGSTENMEAVMSGGVVLILDALERVALALKTLAGEEAHRNRKGWS